MNLRTFAASAIVALGLSLPAWATPISAVGTTDVTVSEPVLTFLGVNGITPSAIAPGTAVGATFSFPITGGETDTLTITHSGGVRLEGGGAFIEVSDFVIEGAGGFVSGTVFGSAEAFSTPVSAELFSLANVEIGAPITADLLITSTLNGALGATFAGGADLGLTGVTFGSAVTAPTPIPLPAGGVLLAGGLLALGALRRRRRAA